MEYNPNSVEEYDFELDEFLEGINFMDIVFNNSCNNCRRRKVRCINNANEFTCFNCKCRGDCCIYNLRNINKNVYNNKDGVLSET